MNQTILKGIKRSVEIFMVFLFMMVWINKVNAANITMGEGTGILGKTPEINIGADLSPGGGEEVAALQFDVNFSAGNLILERVEVGAAAQAAGKGLEFSAISPGKVRVLVYAAGTESQNSIGQGRIAQLIFKLASTAVPGVAPVTLNQIVMCDKDAAIIDSNGTNGAIAIQSPEVYDNLSYTKAYPNPYKSSSGHSRIIFMNLTENSTIKIYTISGELIKVIKEQIGGMAEWDVRNKKGKKIASGIYIYLITNKAGEKKKGKIAIVK